MSLFWCLLRYILRKTQFCTKFKAIVMTLFSYNFPGGQYLKTNRKIRRRVYSVPQETLEYGRRFFLQTEEISNMEKEFECVGTLCDEMFGWICKDPGGFYNDRSDIKIIVVGIMSEVQTGKNIEWGRKIGSWGEFMFIRRILEKYVLYYNMI